MTAALTHEHSFSYDNDPRPGQRSMCCPCGTYLFEHAPGHPYGVQAGPNGMYARWCLRDDCDWRGTTAPGRDLGAVTVAFLLLIVAGCLTGLAVMSA